MRQFVNTPKRTVFRENRIFRWGGCFFDGLSVFFTSAFADVPHQLLKVNDCYKLKKKMLIYLCLNPAKRNKTKDEWFLKFPSAGAFVGTAF